MFAVKGAWAAQPIILTSISSTMVYNIDARGTYHYSGRDVINNVNTFAGRKNTSSLDVSDHL
jgi:hypothetical protein